MFGSKRRREREALFAAGFRPEWREMVAERLRAWRNLDQDQRDRLEDLALHLMAEKSWEAANGFELTDEIR